MHDRKDTRSAHVKAPTLLVCSPPPSAGSTLTAGSTTSFRSSWARFIPFVETWWGWFGETQLHCMADLDAIKHYKTVLAPLNDVARTLRPIQEIVCVLLVPVLVGSWSAGVLLLKLARCCCWFAAVGLLVCWHNSVPAHSSHLLRRFEPRDPHNHPPSAENSGLRALSASSFHQATAELELRVGAELAVPSTFGQKDAD